MYLDIFSKIQEHEIVKVKNKAAIKSVYYIVTLFKSLIQLIRIN